MSSPQRSLEQQKLKHNPIVYFDIVVGLENIGRIEFTLRADMLTACRDEPEVAAWQLLRMRDDAPAKVRGLRALLEWANSPAVLEAGYGIDHACLDQLAKAVGTLFTQGYALDWRSGIRVPLPEACPLLREKNPAFSHSIELVDFSERGKR